MQDVNPQINKQETRTKLNETIDKYTKMLQGEKDKLRSMGNEPRQADALDASQLNTGMEISNSLALHYEKHIKQCRDAIVRLNKGEYGDCIECFDEIEVTRLIKIPHLAHCASCADIAEFKSKRN